MSLFTLHLGKTPASLLQASKEEQHETVNKLIAATGVRGGYYLLLILSVLIVTPGLLMNNAPVVIGGMIIAPVLLPILALSLSIVAGSMRGIRHALTVLLLTLLLTIALSAAVATLVQWTHVPAEWFVEQLDPLLSLLIAFCSGIAAAFASVKEDIAPSIAGVAISVSLLPPLCGAGIGIAAADSLILLTSLRIVAFNACGILLAACLVFILLGFMKAAHDTDKAVDAQA